MKKTATPKTTIKRTPKTRQQIVNDSVEVLNRISQDTGETTAASLARRASMSESMKKTFIAQDVLAQLSSAGLGLNRQIADIQAQATAQFEELRQVEDTLAAKVEALNLANDIEALHDAREALAEDLKAKQVEYAQYTASAQEDHEQALRQQEQTFKDNFSALEKARRAEVEKYEYDLKVLRRNEQDTYDQAKIKRDREEALRLEATNKQFAERDAALKAKEVAYAEALKRIETLDAEIKKAEDKAVAIACGALKKELLNDFALKTKDFEANIGLQNASLKEKDNAITALRTQISALETQNARLQEQVTTIATKAIEGASNEMAFGKAGQILGQTQQNGVKGKQS